MDNPTKVSSNPREWKCPACDSRENLWLNLSDGVMGCGRPLWDGSGGCGEALRHFEQDTDSKFPLVVKLGSITPTEADVFSYAQDENDMVSGRLVLFLTISGPIQGYLNI